MHRRTSLLPALVLFLSTIAAVVAARPRELFPFAPGEFAGVWSVTSCMRAEEATSGTYELHIAPNRKVTGWLLDGDAAIVTQIKGTVSRTGVVRARLPRRGSLTAVISAGDPLTLSGFFRGKCAGTLGSTQNPVTNIVIITNVTVTNIFVVTNGTPLFADPNLLVAVGSALNKPGEYVTTLDLQQVTSLSLWHDGVRDLSGLEYAQQLWDLDLTACPVTNYAPIFNLPRLTRFAPGSGLLTISFVTNLTYLQEFSCADNEFQDVQPLSTLTNLYSISLSRMRITNIGALSASPGLRRLSYSQGDLTNTADFSSLTQLFTLELYGNRIADVGPLTNLTNLRTLALPSNPLTNAAQLAGLSKLETLGLSNCGIQDLDGIGSLTNITILDLSYNPLDDIAVVSNLTHLRWVNFYGSRIPDFSALSGLPELSEVWISYTGCSNLAFAAMLPKLSTLFALSNGITDLSPLAACSKLYDLAVQQNNISSLAPLAACPNLYYLTVSENELGNLNGIEHLTKLTGLYASGNHLTNITALATTQGLQYLYLDGNDLTDISPLIGLTRLYSVYLYNNRLDLSAGSAASNVVQTLRDRGVYVNIDYQRP